MIRRSYARVAGALAALSLALSVVAGTGTTALAQSRSPQRHAKTAKHCQTKPRRASHHKRSRRRARRCTAHRKHRSTSRGHVTRKHATRKHRLKTKATALHILTVGAAPTAGVANPFGHTLAGVAAGGDLQNEAPATLASDLDTDRAVGARWLRVDINWAQIQNGGASSYDWSHVDAVVRGAVARGMNILGVIVYTPSWARPAGTSATYGPDPHAYAAFASAAAAHYSALGVHAYEIWNEENMPASWTPRPNPSHYAALLKDAYPAIHASDPSATVVTGGLSPATNTGSDIAPVAFLRRVYAAGARGSFDAVGDHPYCWPAYPGDHADWSAWYQMYGTTTSLRSLMVSHGDGAKKIWGTEYGAPTGGPAGSYVSPTTQASMIARAVSAWSTYTWAGPLFVYQGRDQGTDHSSIENFFGFVSHNGAPKPAFRSFQRAVAAV